MRKKLRIDDFQELGIVFEATFTRDLSSDEQEILIDRLLSEVIEARNLAMGGGLTGAAISAWDRGSLTEEDITIIRHWLQSNLPIKTLEVSPLRDMWYGWD